jgi:hypothetical protein
VNGVTRIYLDQNKWIDLARAATGHASGARFVPALQSARAAVAAGRASFPLDLYRYSETWKRGDARSRNDVIDVMLELSQHDTIALARDVLPGELETSLRKLLALPPEPTEFGVFGTGLRHIVGDAVNWPTADLAKLDESERAMIAGREAEFERAYAQAFDAHLFRVAPQAVPFIGATRSAASIDEQYAAYENQLGDEIRRRGLQGDLIDVAVRASDLRDIRGAVSDALARHGRDWDEFVAQLDPESTVAFVDSLPSRYVTNAMRSAKLRQSQQKWEAHDFNDVLALSVAGVYCDVVVTEKQWVHRLHAAGVDSRFDTELLRDVAALVPILDGL